MATVAASSWVALALRRLPARLVATLDAWSYRIAQRNAVRRREAWVRRQVVTGK